jgi:hypothetical protein
MRKRGLEELAERVAALEEALGSGRSSELDTRLLAIETALRRLSHGEQELDELGDVLGMCDELLEEQVPAGERVMVAWRGDPAMLALPSRPVVPFPRPTGALADRDFEHGASAIAHLEAQRANGIHFLLIPEQARLWLQDLTSFQEHLYGHYELIGDEEGAGLLIEVGSRRSDDRSSETLVEALDRILDGERYAPVLDWTGFGLNSLLRDRGIFAAPPDTDGELLYLDRSIDVVVVDDPAHVDEGRRVATSAVVLVEPDQAGGIGVAAVEQIRIEPSIAPEPEIAVLSGSDALKRAGEVDSEVVAIAERGVLPLPGCIEAAAATLRSAEEIGAVAVKLLDENGLLEGAGTTVFADGSVEGIGAGSVDVSARWHEYVRPVCAGSGLLVARVAALRGMENGATSLVELSGALRAAGHNLVYQPDAWAVRVLPEESAAEADGARDAWAPVLSRRPERPEALDNSTWRWLVAHDDVEEGWR